MREIFFDFRKNTLALSGLVIIFIFLICALFAPIIAPYKPLEMHPNALLSPPSWKHWFGTDQFGRDILSRIIYGARISFQVGLISVVISLFAGCVIGIIAGYFGGIVDAVLSRVVDVLFSFPDILLGLIIMAVLGPNLTNLMIAIGIVYTPIFARIARGSVLALRDSLYIEAARSMGVSHFKIILRHIFPNSLPPILVQTTLSLAFAILAEAALSFLGLGASPDSPSWGNMLRSGKSWMEQAWWIAVFPGIAITLAVFSFNVIGDGLRDALDPKLKDHAA